MSVKNITALDGALVGLLDGEAAPAGSLPQLHAHGYVTVNGKLTDKGRERARKLKAAGGGLPRGLSGAKAPGLHAVAPKFTT